MEKFDESIDAATHAVIHEFEWMNLPKDDQLGELMIQINDALGNILVYYAPTKGR